MTRAFTVTVTRDLPLPPEDVFDRWTDPDWRARFETPEGSGMRHEGYDTREGGTETVLIEADGAEVGRMIDEIRVMDRPHLLIVQGRGVFDGTVGTTTQTTVLIEPNGNGSKLTGTSQIVARGDHPTNEEVQSGWETMLNTFAELIDEERQK